MSILALPEHHKIKTLFRRLVFFYAAPVDIGYELASIGGEIVSEQKSMEDEGFGIRLL